jgi:hypothetical protein
MRLFFTIAALLHSLFLFCADYDCIFIGSSPVSLFEALYQYGLGKKVLVIDEGMECGGVWKSITICGVDHVDVGCHEIGSNKSLREFLEVYGGCNMICPDSGSAFYFSKGCYELVRNLEEMISKTTIELLLNTRAERAVLDEQEKCIMVEADGRQISGEKIYMSGYSFMNIGRDPPRAIQRSKFYHLYLLVADPSPPRFAYQGGGISGSSRMMNLTRFVGLENTDRQLLVFQVHGEASLMEGERFLEDLKKRNLIDPAAYILTSETYIYEQWPSNSCRTSGEYQPYFETLQTFDFRSMTNQFTRWREVLKPFNEVIR